MAIELGGNKGTLIIGGVILFCFGFGMLVGHLVTPSAPAPSEEDSAMSSSVTGNGNDDTVTVDIHPQHDYEILVENKWEKEKNLIKTIIERINPNNIKENLRYLSEKPHLATTPRDVELAKFIRDKFEEAGFDSSELVPYNVYLSKPDSNNPNKVTLNENGIKIFESSHKEKPIHAGDDSPDFVHAFNAYTPAATVSTAPGVGVVYANYGRIEDFEKLKELGINVTGHVVLVRYGSIYRGNKVRHAEQSGAKGIIIFSDPLDVALNGTKPEDVYDNSFWLPGTGMQRGSTYLGDGDPLTPGWPSTDNAYRIEEDEADLHKIPSQPIGYADAKEILVRLNGDDAPKDWQGGLPGVTYKLGPLFNAQNQTVSLTLSTHNVGKIEKSYNVIGIIKGSIEPDRFVLIGNHRDAWGYGASDPSSGTAQLLETVRVYGTLLKEGWRPRRSLVFCSWGSEEFGLIGSTEWVEEHVDKLQARAVAYVNTDTCASGPMLHIRASPLMHDLFLDITKLIPGVQDSSKTLFDEWKEYSAAFKPDAPEKPIIKGLGSGSDYAPFSVYGGIPAANLWFRRDQVKYNISIYPYYHTGYETFYMVSTFIDPEFKIHQGCGRLASLTIKYLSDSSIIPYSIERLPKIMATNLEKSKNKEKLMRIYDKYGNLESSVQKFSDAVKEFRKEMNVTREMNPLQLRSINDQIMKLEQIFIIPEGLPGRPTVRNALFAPSQFDNYASDGFPGLSDSLYKYDELDDEERMKRDKQIKRHVSDLTIMTDRATSFLKEVYLI